MQLAVKAEAAEAKSRLVHVALLSLNLRLMENWRSVQLASSNSILDYETVMILMAIVVISADKLLRMELEPELQNFERQLPQGATSKVNLISIAAATGVNREKVRRKVNDLVNAGLVRRNREGIQIVQGAIELDVLRKVIDAQLDAIARTVNHLSKIGVLVSSDRPDHLA